MNPLLPPTNEFDKRINHDAFIESILTKGSTNKNDSLHERSSNDNKLIYLATGDDDEALRFTLRSNATLFGSHGTRLRQFRPLTPPINNILLQLKQPEKINEIT